MNHAMGRIGEQSVKLQSSETVEGAKCAAISVTCTSTTKTGGHGSRLSVSRLRISIRFAVFATMSITIGMAALASNAQKPVIKSGSEQRGENAINESMAGSGLFS